MVDLMYGCSREGALDLGNGAVLEKTANFLTFVDH